MKSIKRSETKATQKTKIAYPKQKITILHQLTQAKQRSDVQQQQEYLAQEIDELKTKSNQMPQIDTSNLQAKLTAGQNVTISDNNVISATDTTYTAGANITITNSVISATGGDSSQIANQVEQNTADIAILKSYVTEPDHSYTGRTPADYEEGTIFQTYDSFYQNLNMSSTSTLNFPKIHFCAEVGATATLKLKQKFLVQTTLVDVLLTVKLNGTQIWQETITPTALDTEQIFEKTFYDVALNNVAKGNNILVSLSLASGGTKTVVATYSSLEVIAPNADILSKNCMIDAVEIGGTYYFTDCTSGTLKTASISPNLLYNIGNLTWTDTQIETDYAKTICSLAQYDSLYSLDAMGLLYKNRNNKYVSKFPDYSIESMLNYNLCQLDWREYHDPKVNFVGAIYDAYYGLYVTHSLSTNSFSSNSFSSISPIKVIGNRFSTSYPNNLPLVRPAIAITENGEAYLFRSTSAPGIYANLGYFSDATFYVTSVDTINTFSVVCFLKRFDKIIRREYHLSSNGVELLSELEMGSYDKFFLMQNNDYFVVKSNQLEYHRFVS